MSHYMSSKREYRWIFVSLLAIGAGVSCSQKASENHKEGHFHIETKPELSRQIDVIDRVAGNLAGREFCVDEAYFDSPFQSLSLRQDKRSSMDVEVTVFLNIDQGESAEERRFEFSAKSEQDVGPFGIHLFWRKQDDQLDNEVYPRGYEVSIEFGKWKDDRLPGKITMRLPDRHKSSISGNFAASTDRFRYIKPKK